MVEQAIGRQRQVGQTWAGGSKQAREKPMCGDEPCDLGSGGGGLC